MTNELDLEAIRAQAKSLGVSYHPAQKAETILQNIKKYQESAVAEAPVDDAPAEPTPETPAQAEERIKKEALALIPVTITSMDPSDTALTAVVVSVGNRRLGQVTKAIPFGYKWYMPKILVDHMAQQMFCRSTMIPTPGIPGQERLDTQWIKKYAITYHPAPTPEELAELAKAQAQGNELAK